MSFDKNDMLKIAKLARIQIQSDEVESFSMEIKQILGWIEQLNQIDTSTIDPMVGCDITALHQRQDLVNDGGIRDQILANAPDSVLGFFTVPKVVE
ncbi:MAG: Asp-tRNA(Asn)/Glu-tRNA(Gln) amidotransferase subunit GatC [Alphaproteobacteria bacterium]|nr:Asp-tRNA(Asn)/Glu-tRNA(Gln) amidotransferase subunit GatC [Alphaproteobacteria bacterium]